MSRILFVFSAVSYYREVAPLVADFVARGWQVNVLFGSEGEITDRAARECGDWGCSVRIAPPEVSYGRVGGAAARSNPAGVADSASVAKTPPPATVAEDARRSSLRWPTALLPFGRLKSIPAYCKRMGAIRRFAEQVIGDAMPDVVVQGAYHSCGQMDNAIARVCRARGTAMYCIPNSPYVGERVLKAGRLNHLVTGMSGPNIRVDYDWLNRLLAWPFRAWTRVLADGVRVFYWDPVYMVVGWLWGLAMRRMWMKPSTDFDRVFAYSAYSRDLLVGDGYDPARVMVSGQPLLDSVWKNLGDVAYEKQLFKFLGMPVGSRFVLVNVEPSAEHDYCSWERHWALFDGTLRAVRSTGLPVVLSLHPLCRVADYEFAERQFGVHLCRDRKIHELYPYCAVSVSFPCSTNLMAVPFGIPLLIYDYFVLVSRDEESRALNDLPGSIVVDNAAQLARELQRMVDKKTNAPGRSLHREPARDAIFQVIEESLADRNSIRSISHTIGSNEAKALLPRG